MDLNNPDRVHGEVLDYIDVVEDLLRRETKEEAGIELGNNFKYLKSMSFMRPDGIPVVMVKLAADYAGGDVALEEDSFTDYAWVNTQEVNKYDCLLGIDEEVAMTIQLFEQKS